MLGLFVQEAELIIETGRQGSKLQINRLAACLDQCWGCQGLR